VNLFVAGVFVYFQAKAIPFFLPNLQNSCMVKKKKKKKALQQIVVLTQLCVVLGVKEGNA